MADHAYKTPRTLVCRWAGSHAQSAVPMLARTITSTLHGVGAGRTAVQVRPLRMPGKVASDAPSDQQPRQAQGGRNMFVIRSMTSPDTVVLLVEDPSAPTRAQRGDSGLDDGPHARWTISTVANDAQGTGQPSHFDSFLQRALLQSGGSASQGSNTGPTGGGQWVARGTAISLEGFIFNLGGAGGVGDWEVKVGSITVKGGAAGSMSRGVVVEVTYLGVPYLPPNSTYVRDFAVSLFPQQAIVAGEVEFLAPDHDGLYEAGLTQKPDLAKGEEPGEFEWTELHTAWTLVQMFKREGLL